MMYYVYILLSEGNGKTYVGYTAKSIEERLKEHNQGVSSWTSCNGSFKVIYYESYFFKKDALHREKFLKSGVGKKLVRLIKENF